MSGWKGGHFLLQRVEIDLAGQPARGIEVIGNGRDRDGIATEHCTPHFFDDAGEHFPEVHEAGDNGAVTIGGRKDRSPAAGTTRC